MNAVNLVDPNIGKKVRQSALKNERKSSNKDDGIFSSRVDMVTLASKVGPRKIVDNYETVQFSDLIPKQIPAKKLESADTISKKLEGNELLSLSEEDSIREDRVLAALVGMRFLQNEGGDIKKSWVGGLNPPTDAELDIAYRRLTQRVSKPDEVDNPEYIHNMRIELLDSYREYRVLKKNNETEQSLLESIAA